MSKKSILAYLFVVVLLLTVYLMGYQTTRESFHSFFLLYLTAFTAFYVLYLNRQEWSFKTFLVLAVILRLVLIVAVPDLSNDFYRFLWDGELITRGVNPYGHIPNDLISQGPFYNDTYMRMLYHGMGELSQSNYTVYPVFNQILFYIPATLTDSIQVNVIILKLIMILADIGVILVASRILKLLGRAKHHIWLYALNPFIILEFSGNLHFEGVMIFFLLLAIYYILLDKWLFGAVFMGLAIQVKLIPIILLPFLFKKLKWRRSLGFTAATALVVLILGVLMLNEQLFANMWTSIDLYFKNFEFNASIFYLFREYSMTTVGYDQIAFYGPLLSKIAIVVIALLALFKSYKNDSSIFTGMLFALVIYYAFATTVHPWYISMLLILSIFTVYKFALIWSLLVMLSYSAYATPDFSENTWYILLEYLVVFGVMMYEVIKNTDRKDIGLQLKNFFSD